MLGAFYLGGVMTVNPGGVSTSLRHTSMFTYSHANTPLGQSERPYYLSYFIYTYIHTYIFFFFKE